MLRVLRAQRYVDGGFGAGVQGTERISGVCWAKKAMLVRCEGCGVAWAIGNGQWAMAKGNASSV